MNPRIAILIPNRNSYEMIQLCIESIRKYTDYPNYKIIVFDDNSTNGVDRVYLRVAHEKGWLEYIEGNRLENDLHYDRERGCHPSHYWHGKALNILVGACDTKYAIIMDCDVYIKDYGWLQDFLGLAKDEKVLAVVNEHPRRMQRTGGYVMPIYTFWFGFLNMQAYHDGMQVDWVPTIEDRRKEPYQTLFADMYPPEITDFFKVYKIDPNVFQRDRIYTDPGSKLWMKVTFENPKGYKVVHVPATLVAKHHHFSHISVYQMPYATVKCGGKYEDKRFTLIRTELAKLRP